MTSHEHHPIEPGVLHASGRIGIATLGPTGTSSERSANYLVDRLRIGHGQVDVLLFDSYEDAAESVTSGEATHLLVANAYAQVDAFYMSTKFELQFVFVLDTAGYGIASQGRSPIPLRVRIATHRAPRALIKQLLPSGYLVSEVVEVSSTASAAIHTFSGASDLALTTVDAAKRCGLNFISTTRTIRMVWSVFGLAPEGTWLPSNADSIVHNEYLRPRLPL